MSEATEKQSQVNENSDPKIVKLAGGGNHQEAFKEVDKLIRKDKDVNAKDRDGNTALHAAARAGNVNLVKRLSGKGANKDAKNNKGETPADVAKDDSIRDQIGKGLDKNANKTAMRGGNDKKDRQHQQRIDKKKEKRRNKQRNESMNDLDYASKAVESLNEGLNLLKKAAEISESDSEKSEDAKDEAGIHVANACAYLEAYACPDAKVNETAASAAEKITALFPQAGAGYCKELSEAVTSLHRIAVCKAEALYETKKIKGAAVAINSRPSYCIGFISETKDDTATVKLRDDVMINEKTTIELPLAELKPLGVNAVVESLAPQPEEAFLRGTMVCSTDQPNLMLGRVWESKDGKTEINLIFELAEAYGSPTMTAPTANLQEYEVPSERTPRVMEKKLWERSKDLFAGDFDKKAFALNEELGLKKVNAAELAMRFGTREEARQAAAICLETNCFRGEYDAGTYRIHENAGRHLHNAMELALKFGTTEQMRDCMRALYEQSTDTLTPEAAELAEAAHRELFKVFDPNYETRKNILGEGEYEMPMTTTRGGGDEFAAALDQAIEDEDMETADSLINRYSPALEPEATYQHANESFSIWDYLKFESEGRDAENAMKLAEKFGDDEDKGIAAEFVNETRKSAKPSPELARKILEMNEKLLPLLGRYETAKTVRDRISEGGELAWDELGELERAGYADAEALASRLAEDTKPVAEDSPQTSFVCNHSEKGVFETVAADSYTAARNAAEYWKLDNVAGIDCRPATTESGE